MHVSKNSLSIHLLVLANLYRVTNLYLALYSVLGGGGVQRTSWGSRRKQTRRQT